MLKTKVNTLFNNKNNLFRLCVFLVFSTYSTNAQISINKPVLGFSEVCASPTFNTFNLSFTFSPVSNLLAGNTFKVELSDASGSFATPTLLTTSNSTTSPVNVNFSFPTSINGTGYKIRIKSSAPASLSPSSDSFSANYAVYNQPFTINNNVTNQNICSGSTYTLSIDSTTNGPLQYPQLTYLWYKDNVLIPGQNTSSLPVTQNGVYFCKINYGNCTLNAYSNFVTITTVSAPTLTISSQDNVTTICSDGSVNLTSSITDSSNTYQWYLNNVAITGATNDTYTASQPGAYSLKIPFLGCDLISNNITLVSFDDTVVTMNVDSAIVIEEGESIEIIPNGGDTYDWYINGTLFGTANTYTSNQEETIQMIAHVGNCTVNKDLTVTFKERKFNPFIPNTITPNNDGKNDTWIIPEEYSYKDDVQVVIFNSNNIILYKSNFYKNNWPIENVEDKFVYYFKIIKNESVVEKGTISVINK